jgi:predicted HTH transcriptional regulator
MITEEHLAELIAYGREQNSVEFKGPGPRTDRQLQAKVIRAMLGMANRRDGGLVIVGIAEDSESIHPVGLSGDDLRTWKYDYIADAVAVYADPPISFEAGIVLYEEKKFLVIRVNEFDDIPVLCKRDYEKVLAEGALYIRSNRKPETTIVRSYADMRELLDLATEKRLRKFLATARAVGINIIEAARPSDEELFERQLGDLK